MNDKRRPKGTGSVRTRQGQHQATYSFLDGAGRRRRRSRIFTTRTAAREWLTARLAEVATGQVADAGGIAIGEYLTLGWKGFLVRSRRRPPSGIGGSSDAI